MANGTVEQNHWASEQDTLRASRRAAWLWGSLVVGFLGTQVIGGAFAVYLATGDPTVAIVPDYHTKALDWDKELATRHASDALHWQSSVQVSELPDTSGNRQIVVRLQSASGLPIVDVTGDARLYHHARANNVQRVPLVMQESGVYVGTAQMTRDGMWQFELDLHGVGDDHFVNSQVIDVTSDSKGTSDSSGAVQ